MFNFSLQACAQTENKEDVPPTVVEGISVDNADAKTNDQAVEESNVHVEVAEERSDDVDVAEDRSAKADAAFDQIALESQVAEDRDHSVVVPAPSSYGSPVVDNYNAPAIDTYGAPAIDTYGAPVADNYNAPSADSYGAPQAPPVEDAYGAPQAPVEDAYGAPQAPVEDAYGAPQAPVETYNPPSGPIPVPLPVPVQPGSIVLPQGPSYNAPPPPRPSYKPPPPPPKRPSYRPPPPQKRPPPPKPSYKPPPPPPTYKPKPSYKPPPPPPTYKPKPSYKPPPPKPSYKPPQSPPKPAYGPPPAPAKPQYKPAKPQYNPPPPPPPSPAYQPEPTAVAPSYQQPEAWPQAQPDMPKIVSLDVTCEKNLMKVFIEFDKPFYGIIFSKGHYSDVNCVHLPAGLGRTSAKFDVSINSCGTTGNTENGLYGYGADSGSGTFFENTIVVQYDPQVQEVWDQARKLRCTWHDQYEKSVTFRPFPVDMLDVVRADFAGDNVGCWMQIQVGKGPWASEVSGLVKIGQTMTMVLAIKDDDNKFDMLVRNCMAHDGKRAPIQLVDQKGCVTRPKLMSKFTKIKNFGASASVLSYAHFQAFKFPDSMEVHFQCTIQICRYQCPDQCESAPPAYETPQVAQDSYGSPQAAPEAYGAPAVETYGAPAVETYGAPVVETYGAPAVETYGAPVVETYNAPAVETYAAPAVETYGAPVVETYGAPAVPSYQGRSRREAGDDTEVTEIDLEDVGVQKVIQVVSSGDLTFAIKESDNETVVDLFPSVRQTLVEDGYICMSTPAFAATLVILLAILIISCLLSAFLCLRHRSFYGETSLIAAFAHPVFAHKKGHF